MKAQLLAFLQSPERNELAYWLGLLLLFLGLSLGVSMATALIVTGAVIAGESVLTSYVASWLGARK